MIRYFDTEAAYAAAAKSAAESDISLVAATNASKIDGRNTVIGLRYAKTGDIVVLDSAGALHFIDLDSFEATSFPTSEYTYVGVVGIGVDHEDYHGQVLIINKANANKALSAIYSYRLTGYTLDGTDRTGTLKVYSAASTYDNYTISYNASSIADLVTTLNTYFQANTPFTTQHWRAIAIDTDGDNTADAIDLQMLFTFADQRNCAGSAGFTLTANLFPDWLYTSNMFRMNGQRSGEGTIGCMARAIAYFSQDLNNASYNPASDVTSPKRSYPICLPGYLGTSAYQSDHCAALRAIYGPGRAGWLKFMESFLPVKPTFYGSIGDKKTYGDGKTNSAYLATQKFTKQDDTVIDASPAAAYAAEVSYNNELLKAGSWFIPDADQLTSILKDIKYNTSASRTADKINRGLYLIGGSAVSNGSYTWSSSRCNANSGWYCYGGNGCTGSNFLFNTYLALPVTLLEVSDSEL